MDTPIRSPVPTTVLDVLRQRLLADEADRLDRVFMNNSTFEAERRVDALYASVGLPRTRTIEGKQGTTIRVPIRVWRPQ